MSQTINSTPSLSHNDNTANEDRVMPTCVGADDLIAKLKSYQSRPIHFNIVEGGDGPTSLVQGKFNDSTKVSLLARRRIPTQDSARDSLPHTTTALSYILAKFTDRAAEGTSSPPWTLCVMGVMQDRPGSYRPDPEDPKLGWSEVSFELIAGKIDPEDLSRYPEDQFDDPKEREEAIMIGAHLRELKEEGGHDRETCEFVKVLGITPVTHKDAGLTNATNTRVITLSVLKMPVEELPPSRELSKNEIEQGLTRWIMPLDEFDDVLSQAIEKSVRVDTQVVEMGSQYKVGSKCRTGGIRDVVEGFKNRISNKPQSSYTQADLWRILEEVEETATQGRRDTPTHWYTDALSEPVKLSEKHARSLGVIVG